MTLIAIFFFLVDNNEKGIQVIMEINKFSVQLMRNVIESSYVNLTLLRQIIHSIGWGHKINKGPCGVCLRAETADTFRKHHSKHTATGCNAMTKESTKST
jgi:hypothetical protein